MKETGIATATGAGTATGGELYSVYLLWVTYLAGLVLVYAHWWAWFGGDTWGPRFFLIASLPASLAIAVRLHSADARVWSKALTLVALALSCWVGLSGAVFFEDSVVACTQGYDKLVTLCAYTPQDSALWHVLDSPLALGKANSAYIAYTLVVFGYLAVPLAGEIARAIGRELADFVRARAGLWAWRF